jgi:hypothetical protein
MERRRMTDPHHNTKPPLDGPGAFYGYSPSQKDVFENAYVDETDNSLVFLFFGGGSLTLPADGGASLTVPCDVGDWPGFLERMREKLKLLPGSWLLQVPPWIVDSHPECEPKQKQICQPDGSHLPAPAFRRNRQRGLTDASIKRAIRAALAEAPNAIVEVDPINQKIRITSGGTSPAAPVNELDRELEEFEARLDAKES